MSEQPSFAGTYSFGTLKGFLDTGMEHREILIKMQERFAGTPAVVGIPSAGELRAMHVDKRTVIQASSPYLVAAYNSIGVEYGTRGIFPWELEQVIVAGKWQWDKCYVDTGLVLDFSGREHALARDVYKQMPREQRTLEGLPAVVANVSLEKTGVRKGFPQGLRFVVHEAMELRHAPALLGVSGYFDVRDAGLVKTGVPEKIVAEQLEGVAYRYLCNYNIQKEKKLENIGISRLCLRWFLDVDAGNDDLAGSGEGGRVVPVFGAEGASREKMGVKEKRTPLTDIELAPDGNFYHEGKVWAMFENSISWMKSEEEKERARMAFREGMRKEKRD